MEIKDLMQTNQDLLPRYSVRHLNPDFLNNAQASMDRQLQMLKAAQLSSTSERVERDGFILNNIDKVRGVPN